MKALSTLAVLMSALLLQGCIAAAVVGTAAVGTKAATDPRTVGTQVDDGTLELRVNSALSKDEQIKKEARINVTAYQGKVLLAISARGNSRDIVKAVEAAVTRDMTIVALTGYDGGELAGLLGPQDVEIRIPSHRSARIHEMHMLTVNCLCDLIDNTLFPHQDD